METPHQADVIVEMETPQQTDVIVEMETPQQANVILKQMREFMFMVGGMRKKYESVKDNKEIDIGFRVTWVSPPKLGFLFGVLM